MAGVEYGITRDGFVKKPFEVIVAETETIVKEYLGSDTDLSEYGWIGQIIRVFSYREYQLWEILELVFYSGYLESATGENLDRVMALLGLLRKPAAKATGSITITGPTGTTIAKGHVVRDTAGEIKFVTSDAVTIGLEPVQVNIIAYDYGPDYNLPAETLVALMPQVPLVTITQPEPTSGGRALETDEELRERGSSSPTVSAKATIDAIQTALEQANGIDYADVTEDTLTNTINIMVAGSITDDEVDAIVMSTKPAGIGYEKDRLIDETISVYGAIEPTTFALNGVTLINSITEEVTRYINKIPLGTEVSWWDLYRHLIKNISAVNEVSTLEIFNTYASATPETNPLTEKGNTFPPTVGRKFKADTVNFWIHGRENEVTISYIVEKEDGVDDTELHAAISDAITVYCRDIQMGDALVWNDFHTVILETTIDSEPCVATVLYLKIDCADKSITSPGSSIPVEETYYALLDTCDGTTSTPQYITGRVLVEREETGNIETITNIVNQILLNAIWALGVGTDVTTTHCTNITQAILNQSGNGIRSIVSIELTSGEDSVTPTLGQITVPDTATPCMLADANTIIVGTTWWTNVFIIIERLAGEDSAEITSAAQTNINAALQSAGLGVPISWNDVRDAVVNGDASINSIYALTIQTNSGSLSSQGELPTTSTAFVQPNEVTIKVIDLIPTTVEVTVVPAGPQFTDSSIQQDIIQRLTSYFNEKNADTDHTLRWSNVYDTILTGNEKVHSISTLSITAKSQTITTGTGAIALTSTEYIEPSITVTVS